MAPIALYTLSLHDALPISSSNHSGRRRRTRQRNARWASSWRKAAGSRSGGPADRSEEHTSELQSHSDLVCRLLLEKKKHNSIQENVVTVDGTIHNVSYALR